MKRSLLTLTLSLAVVFTAFGQLNNEENSATATDNENLERIVHANATIITGFAAYVTAHVNFGQISGTAGGTATAFLAPEGSTQASDNINGTDASAGEVTLTTVTQNLQVSLGWNTDVTLTNTAGDESITFTPTLTWTDGTLDYAELTTPGGSTLNFEDNATPDNVVISIGGELSDFDGNSAGAYTTENTNGVPLTLTIDYSGI